jgi:hypothetical protein
MPANLTEGRIILRKHLTIIWVSLLVVASGCSGLPTLPPMPTLPVSAPPSATPAPFQLITATPLPDQAATILPVGNATSLPTNGVPTVATTPYMPFSARAAVDSLNLRVQPGHLSEIVRMLTQDTPLTVLGQTPGGEWIFVQTAEGITGWVFWQLITSETDLRACPVLIPEGIQTVRGQLTDKAGQPVVGVQFAVEQGDLRSDGMTDAQGIFFVFLPSDASGEWVASFTAISCDSPLMDANCNCRVGACNGPDPVSINFSLPTEGTLTFIWK